jgi:hypothetical protein
MIPNKISNTTWQIIYATKQKEFEYNFIGLKSILAPLYHDDMKLDDVISILISSLNEVISEPRFELNYQTDFYRYLLRAPLKYHMFENIETIEQVYDKIIQEILSAFGVSKSDWCLNELKAIGDVWVNGEKL